MKILYITEQDLNNNSGITQKVLSQVDFWRKANHTVSVINFNSLSESNSPKRGSIFPRQILSFLFIWINGYKLFKHTQNEKYDLIYSRSFLWSVFWNLIGQETPIIFEINGDIDFELRARSYLTFLYNKFTTPFMLLASKGLICVSHELNLKYFRLPLPKKVIANGIVDEFFNIPIENFFNEKQTHIVFTQTANKEWHGLDKILFFINLHPDLHLHVIGKESENSSQVTYHGILSRNESFKIMSKCHLAFSSLALHRKSMYEASPLKSREYLAMGLPVVLAYQDTDFLSPPYYFLQISNEENNLILEGNRVYEFCQNARHAKREQIREDAKIKISASKKEIDRLKFFKLIMQESSKTKE
jgi:hypothetical protein